jgi:hypothetical protein
MFFPNKELPDFNNETSIFISLSDSIDFLRSCWQFRAHGVDSVF